MGEVYRAYDTALEREVAVKILPADMLATPDRRRRFETEAKSAANVSHPNLVAVYDVGESGGVPYIVQELIRGETVSQLLARQGPLPVERVAEWGAQAAEGLAKAHDAGIVHRDVKPGNLIVDEDGRVRVLDFGLAKFRSRSLADGAAETEAGLVVGSVHYMSPEQAMGRELDARSDAFALGIVLYEMATGRRPFEGDSTVETMHRIAYESPRPIQAADPPLPPAFVTILEKALEKLPEDRYQSLREMAVDLQRLKRRPGSASTALQPQLAAGEPTRQLASGAQPRTFRRRRRRLLPLAVTAVAAGAFLAAVVVASRRLPRVQPPSATRFLVQTDSCEETPVYAPDGHAFAYASNEHGDYDVYYRLLSGGSPVRLTSSPEDERDPCFTRDGATLYYTRGDPQTGGIWAVAALGGTPRRILDRGDQPSFDPDGGRLLYRRWDGGRSALYLARPDGSEARALFTPEAGEVLGARFSPDGRKVAFLWREAYPGALGDLYTMPAGGGAPERLTRDRKDVWGHVEWLRGARAVLYGAVRTGGANIWMVGARGGEPTPVSGGSGWLISPSLSPDGRSLLVQTQRDLSDAWEFSLPGGAARPLTRAGVVWAPLRLPDGRLLYGDWARQEEELDLYVQEASGARTLIGQGSNPRASADGKHVYCSVASGGGRRGLTALEVDGGPARRLTQPAGIDEYPDPTPDGTGLVFCRSAPKGKSSEESGVLLLTLAGGRTRTLFSGDAMSSRGGASAVVFQSCAAPQGCGVYAVPYGGGPARRIVPEGRWPALSPDRKTVYALIGPKARPVLVKTPIEGGPVTTVFEFNPQRDPRFWAVFTVDVSADERSVVVTHQRNDDDIVLLEGVFR